MKRPLLFILIFLSIKGYSQDTSYLRMIRNAEEISFSDSLDINADNWQLQRLDSNDVKKWFYPLLGSTNNNRLKNRSYFLAGKMTRNPNFDMLLVLEQKKHNDTVDVEIIHLVTSRKDGHYIANVEAAVSGNKKKSNYNTVSKLYGDMRLRKIANITVNDKSLDEVSWYWINNSGRFILTASH